MDQLYHDSLSTCWSVEFQLPSCRPPKKRSPFYPVKPLERDVRGPCEKWDLEGETFRKPPDPKEAL